MTPGQTVGTAVAAAMETVSTLALALTTYRFTAGNPGWAVAVLVSGTVWILCTVFCTAVAWDAGGRVLAKPPPKPPTPPPSQPRPPKPPRREVTLVDMAPVVDITQRIPRSQFIWRPRVSETAADQGHRR